MEVDPKFVPVVLILIVAAASLIVEGLSWLCVYRTASYKRIVGDITAVGKKFAIIAEGPQSDKDIPKKKKKLEHELMVLTREFTIRCRGITGMFTFAALFGVYR